MTRPKGTLAHGSYLRCGTCQWNNHYLRTAPWSDPCARVLWHDLWVKGSARLYFALAAGSLLISMLWGSLGLPVETPAAFPLHFYQHIVGPMDGRSCPSYPVCSLYARQAVARHGLLVGSWLALGRLIHEGDDLRNARWVRVDGKVYSYDPLSRNDFWLKE